jgi:nicotinic acetylcholine receptor, invertebrate
MATFKKKWSMLNLFFSFQVSLTLYNNKDYVDLSDYWKSGTWDIIEVPAYLNVHNDSIPTETDITFYITIRSH